MDRYPIIGNNLDWNMGFTLILCLVNKNCILYLLFLYYYCNGLKSKTTSL